MFTSLNKKNIAETFSLVLFYSYLRLISTPVYSCLDLINLIRYLLISNWFFQIFLYHYILRFLHIKSIQICAPQDVGDSLKKFLFPTCATKNKRRRRWRLKHLCAEYPPQRQQHAILSAKIPSESRYIDL